MKQYITHITLIALIFLAACSNRVLDFTVLSTKPMNLQTIASYQRASAPFIKEYTSVIIFIPVGGLTPKSAVDMTLETIPGAVALLDGSITHNWWSFIFYGEYGYTITGTALIDPSKVSNADSINQYTIARVDKDGATASIEAVSKETFMQALDK